MKKKLFSLIASFALCMLMFATDNMFVKFRDGKIVEYTVDDVEEVYFGPSTLNDTTAYDSTVVDVSDTPLEFKIISDSTAEVTSGNYLELDSVVIPEKVRIDGKVYAVTRIGIRAFSMCTNLVDVVIPSSIEMIGSNAFENSGLKSVVLPENVEVEYEAFYGSSLTSVVVSSGVFLGHKTFYGCSALENVEIEPGAKNIGKNGFFECRSLKNLVIPSSVTSIREGAFGECKNLDLVIDNSRNNVNVGEAAFGCKTVTFTKPYDSSVADSRLTYIVKPDSTVEVSSVVYSVHLDTLIIPSRVMIEGRRYYDVTSIRPNAFSRESENYYLTYVEIPSSIKTIGEKAFYGCGELDVVIENVENNLSVEENAFEGCKSVRYLVDKSMYEMAYNDSIVVDAADSPLGFSIRSSNEVSVYCKDTTQILGSIVIPANVRIDGVVYKVREVSPESFWKVKGLTSVVIPSTVGLIGAYSFRECEDLRCVFIPSSVTWVEPHAFESCKNLYIIIDNTISKVERGIYAYSGCKSVIFTKNDPEPIPFDSTVVIASESPINFYVLDDYNYTAGIATNDSSKMSDTLIIPAKVQISDKVYNVTSIDMAAFIDCVKITSVVFPSTLTSIGEAAFLNCTGLTKVVIPSNVTTIENGAFYNCTNLDVVIDNSKDSVKVGPSTFEGCKSVTYLK
jgi:hypothetical protein